MVSISTLISFSRNLTKLLRGDFFPWRVYKTRSKPMTSFINKHGGCRRTALYLLNKDIHGLYGHK